MKKTHLSILSFALLSMMNTGCGDGSKPTPDATTSKYKYEEVAGDPIGLKLYTLSNGMRVYMSVNKSEPRIQTYIACRTGSRNDPADATGLAHYLEHMLFKGTSKMGSLDWEKEKVILQQISDLYEKHRQVTPEERPAIYKQIDSLSQEAAKLVAANEYDKMISTLGAKGTNAYTSLDRTVYVNDIPSNELEKWLVVESERFKELVLRLFHTELEAVYEEFNINQNRDGRKVFQNFLNGLLPNHPYGTQTTIGTGEHLKTPSMVKIHEYFSTYYVPNNMAIVLSGDINPDETVALIEKYFGDYKSKDVPKFEVKAQPEITAPVVREVVGKEKALVDIGWALSGGASRDFILAEMIAQILYNGKAGLIDINLVQKQRIGEGSYSFAWSANDFSFFGLYGSPREGQTLEQVRDSLMAQLELVRQGKFEDWMLDAIINNMEYNEIKYVERNDGRADFILDAFIYDIPWKQYISRIATMRQVTKQELVDFANKNFKPTNCVVVFKREGEDKNIYNVDKPKITPVPLNRDTASLFRNRFDSLSSPRQKPVFVDFKKEIKSAKLKSGVQFDYIKNPDNATFDLNYVVDMGSLHDPALPIAIKYLPFLGTDKYSPEDLQKEFFKLGVSFDVYSSKDVCYVTLSGLERSLEKGIELFEHILHNIQPNEEALKNLVLDIKKERADIKKDKNRILSLGMSEYARYGKNSPLRNQLGNAQLDTLTAQYLVNKLKGLLSYQHTAFYYGQKADSEVAALLDKYHQVPASLLPIPAPAVFAELPTNENKVVLVNFSGMTQAEIMLMSKGTPNFSMDENVMSRLYNDYFGSGLSSIVFQEIRESKALAYSAYANFTSPANKNEAHYMRAFVGTQTDKMATAIPAMQEIIENMPVAEDLIAGAIDAILKKIESERITKDDIYWTYRSNKKRGYEHDTRKDAYDKYSQYTSENKQVIEEFKNFHAQKVKGRQYTYMVLGDKSKLDQKYLQSLGKVEEVKIDDLFVQ